MFNAADYNHYYGICIYDITIILYLGTDRRQIIVFVIIIYLGMCGCILMMRSSPLLELRRTVITAVVVCSFTAATRRIKLYWSLIIIIYLIFDGWNVNSCLPYNATTTQLSRGLRWTATVIIVFVTWLNATCCKVLYNNINIIM